MKKTLLIAATLGLSLSAFADNSEITCIGKLGGLDTRVIINANDVLSEGTVEIRTTGDFAYTGKIEVPTGKLNGPTISGQLKSVEGKNLRFMLSLVRGKTLKANIGTFDGTQNLTGKLSCVLLD